MKTYETAISISKNLCYFSICLLVCVNAMSKPFEPNPGQSQFNSGGFINAPTPEIFKGVKGECAWDWQFNEGKRVTRLGKRVFKAIFPNSNDPTGFVPSFGYGNVWRFYGDILPVPHADSGNESLRTIEFVALDQPCRVDVSKKVKVIGALYSDPISECTIKATSATKFELVNCVTKHPKK